MYLTVAEMQVFIPFHTVLVYKHIRTQDGSWDLQIHVHMFPGGNTGSRAHVGFLIRVLVLCELE